jgi:hypothetical protein
MLHDPPVSPPDANAIIRSHQRIGVKARIATPGREDQLVRAYLSERLPDPESGEARTIFCEPRLESGFPDAVVAYWKPAVTYRWSTRRANLTTADLRGYQWILSQGLADLDHDQLEVDLPYARPPRETIRRLRLAGLLLDVDNGLRVAPISANFAVTRLIAIEAKLKEQSRGLLQAARNGWFASESYLLTERASSNPILMERARSYGVGLIGQEDDLCQPAVAAERRALPVSYASWLFNEWAWRAAWRR